ncbi:MAG: hypothetical protein QOF78_103, partial [Phycisphaerales bacterium]|nr:hypothetical protein [Phycisphaerales bacterium]
AQPSPVPAPGTPTDFKVELRQDGAVILKWKCPNPPGSQGTTYDVRRKVGAQGGWQHIGATGIRTLTDETVPAGSSQVTYEITGFRSTRRGSPANFIVNFGVGGEGEMTASVVATPRTTDPRMTDPRMAA